MNTHAAHVIDSSDKSGTYRLIRNVVTGGAGFVGSHLTEFLINSGEEVVVLDELSTAGVGNLRTVIGHPRLILRNESILDRSAVRRALSGADRVFHPSAAARGGPSGDSPLASLERVHGTENILDAALEANIPTLFTCTGRLAGHEYWNELGLPVTTVRLFNTVGPRQTGSHGMVVPKLVGQALRHEPLTVHGDGEQTRCFSYIGDVVPAMVALLEDERSRGQVFHLGGAEEISIVSLAQRILDVTGCPGEITLVPYEQAYGVGHQDARRRVPDNSKAYELVGFIPRTPLDAMILNVAWDIAEHSKAPIQVPALPRQAVG